MWFSPGTGRVWLSAWAPSRGAPRRARNGDPVRLNWLRDVCTKPGPFATVLLDVSHDTEDAAHRDELRRRGVRDEWAGRGAPDAVIEVVDAALADADPPDGTAGRVLVADVDGVLLDALTPAPPLRPRTDWARL